MIKAAAAIRCCWSPFVTLIWVEEFIVWFRFNTLRLEVEVESRDTNWYTLYRLQPLEWSGEAYWWRYSVNKVLMVELERHPRENIVGVLI